MTHLRNSILDLFEGEKESIRQAIHKLYKISPKFYLEIYSEAAESLFSTDGWSYLKKDKIKEYELFFEGKMLCRFVFLDKKERKDLLDERILFRLMFHFEYNSDSDFNFDWINFLENKTIQFGDLCGFHDFAAGDEILQERFKLFQSCYQYPLNKEFPFKDGVKEIRRLVKIQNSIPLYYIHFHY